MDVVVGRVPARWADASFSSFAPRLVDAFLAGRTGRTLAAYRQDLDDLRRFLGAPMINAVTALRLLREHGAANGLALAYRAQLTTRGLAAATINQRLAALRSLVKLTRTLSLVPWVRKVEGVGAKRYRETRGPSRGEYLALLDTLQGQRDARAVRHRVVVQLLFDLALRCGEIVSLDVAHVDLAAGTIAVLGKGRSGRTPLTPPPTAAVLRDRLVVRDSTPGSHFLNVDQSGKGSCLTGASIYRIVRDLGRDISLAVRPHGLRHAVITEALDRTGGDVRTMRRFSRHGDVRVLTMYGDNRIDLGAEIARLIVVEP